ncbi:hypothetical protein [Burkholderia puraquae]|uniref:hypothetical protein n=1 Tax=Burkholderia puraquae TaxID=1904757 RepID=UPI001054DC9F|nr:hypothetical protein [Burkholderia puraquae]
MPYRFFNIGLYCRIYGHEFELIRAENWLARCRERGVRDVRWVSEIVIILIIFFTVVGSK